jgi:homoserine dehydrogenase
MPFINVGIVGVGLVGREFISQLLSVSQHVHANRLRIVSISSSTSTLFSPSGFSPKILAGWQAELANPTSDHRSRTDFNQLTAQLQNLLQMQGDKVILVDNTASEEVAGLYPTFLDAGIAVITPNKKAYSGNLGLYERILSASAKSGALFLNEATVGAGLPIISTLKDLVATGDTVRSLLLYKIALLVYSNDFLAGPQN